MRHSFTLHRSLSRPNPVASGLALALAVGSGAIAAAVPNAAFAAPATSFWVPAMVANGAPPPRPPARSLRDPRGAARVSSDSPQLPAGSIPVTNCDDSGPGSLRDAVLSAASGQTIDLTNTGCSFITLTTGAIGVAQASLTLQGPSSNSLEISGNSTYQIFSHTGGGTLTIDHLTLAAGSKYQTGAQLSPARGGCVFSNGTLSVSNSDVKYCQAKDTSSTYGVKGGALYATSGVTLSYSSVYGSQAYSTAAYARGGGIYTPGTLNLDHSLISGNESKTLAVGPRATGGGIEVRNGMLVKYSTIDGNDAAAPNAPNYYSFGGGVYGIGGSITIENSTISNNNAQQIGGVALATTNASAPMEILSSTISQNTAGVHGGVAVFNDTSMTVSNSTIAFNATGAQLVTGAGLYLNSASVDLESTIISGNSSNGFGDDVRGEGTFAFTGANNLIQNPWATVPADTLTNVDPMLSLLANNGGPTNTNALSLDSPAVDMGNDNAAVSYDQRGPGYPRTIGANVDIGAFEADTTDRIFANGFD